MAKRTVLAVLAVSVIILLFIAVNYDDRHSRSIASLPEFLDRQAQCILDLVFPPPALPTPRVQVDPPEPIYLGPNVTQCSASLSDDYQPVNCCAGIPSYTEEELLATAKDFEFPVFNESEIRVRRPVHKITDKDFIERYRRATEIMKNLPITNPHCFARQANIHCSYCTGAFKEANYELLLRIHRSRLFFPFHRAYLYFYERIVGKIIGDDSFAIPYWNWDVPEGMYMPDMFMNGSLYHFKREKSHFPPRVTQNDFYKSDEYLGPEKQVEANLALMYVQMVSGAKTPELFMGCPLKAGPEGWCMGLGTIEMSPHNSLHSWTGITSLPELEDMGAFYSAARDPLFYAHHSNIDRLWHVWRELNDFKEEWSDPEWFNSFFYFYDENQQLVRVRVSDMLDQSKLGYRYVPSETPWLDYKPKPLVDPKVAKKELSKLKKGQNMPLFGSNIRRLDGTFTVNVPRSMPKPVGEEEEERKDGKKMHTEEILVVYGIHAEKDEAIKFDVFINMVNESMAIASDVRVREYAGAFQTMSSGKKSNAKKVGNIDEKMVVPASKMKTTFKIGISDLLRDLDAVNDDSIWVTVVPRGLFDVTIEGMRIEYQRW